LDAAKKPRNTTLRLVAIEVALKHSLAFDRRRGKATVKQTIAERLILP